MAKNKDTTDNKVTQNMKEARHVQKLKTLQKTCELKDGMLIIKTQ